MDKQVLCFGEVLWDGFGAGKTAGGAPMNVAMHLLQQQISAQMLTRIGDDALGDELFAYLQKQNFPDGFGSARCRIANLPGYGCFG